MELSKEQKEATAIDDNLVVNAGAGSGKTTVLTARYIRLLEEGGLSPAQIVAITFTKKAAREMRERIDEQLAGLSRENPRWKEDRDQLVSAPIGTIHSFYARVLRSFPVEAGINPSFRVLDELEASLMLDKAVAAAFQQAAAEKCPHLALLTEVLGAEALEEEGN
ncbi:MAG: UvrD-helicase domain-containing protein, partial [Eubacteriales bacterium]|nr:UvrD-helicase domain-containing protein [Eubacteriales bacterium]